MSDTWICPAAPGTTGYLHISERDLEDLETQIFDLTAERDDLAEQLAELLNNEFIAAYLEAAERDER